MPAAGRRSNGPQKPPQEYSYSVMAVHPVTGKDIPRAVFDDESEAHKDAAHRNEQHSNYSHHVKRIKKGTSGGSGGAAPSRNR